MQKYAEIEGKQHRKSERIKFKELNVCIRSPFVSTVEYRNSLSNVIIGFMLVLGSAYGLPDLASLPICMLYVHIRT